MRCLVTSARPYDQQFLSTANNGRHELVFIETTLNAETAFIAQGYPDLCPFVDDRLDAKALETIAHLGTKLLVLRSTGFNHVDIPAAEKYGISVTPYFFGASGRVYPITIEQLHAKSADDLEFDLSQEAEDPGYSLDVRI